MPGENKSPFFATLIRKIFGLLSGVCGIFFVVVGCLLALFSISALLSPSADLHFNETLKYWLIPGILALAFSALGIKLIKAGIKHEKETGDPTKVSSLFFEGHPLSKLSAWATILSLSYLLYAHFKNWDQKAPAIIVVLCLVVHNFSKRLGREK